MVRVPKRCLRAIALIAALLVVMTGLSLTTASFADSPGDIQLASSKADGSQGNVGNNAFSAISANGRYVVFSSASTDLVTPATTVTNVFRKDLLTGEVRLCSSDSVGVEGNADSSLARISADGTYVSFESLATNLVTPATTLGQVFWKDMASGLVILVSANAAGVEGDAAAGWNDISADGRYVAFASPSTNLVVPATTVNNVFRKDLYTGEVLLGSSTAAGAEGNAASDLPAISDDGNFVAFGSSATNLVVPATPAQQAFRKNFSTGEIVVCSSSATGTYGNGTYASSCDISRDGRYVVFDSDCTNLVTPATTAGNVFRKDASTGAIVLCSTSDGGAGGNGPSSWSKVSSDGRYVAFHSAATNLAATATTTTDVFRKDLVNGTVVLASATASGAEGNNASLFAGMSGNGRYVSFVSVATNLVTPATTGAQIFRKELAISPIWYFAEGTTRPGFDPYLTIQNPGLVQAGVRITYLKADATEEVNDFLVPPNSRFTIRIADWLGVANDAAHDFSILVESTNGQEVICERPVYFDYTFGGVDYPGGHDVVGALTPSPTWYFAEGTTRPGFDSYLTIQNPGAVQAQVDITYLRGDATQRVDNFTVAARSRFTVRVADWLGVANDTAHDFSAVVQSTNGVDIICERSMYFDYTFGDVSYPGGHDVVGALSAAPTWYFAEGTTRPGFDPYLTIQNPNGAPADVFVYYLRGDASQRVDYYPIAAQSRYTIRVADWLGVGDDAAHDFSAVVQSANGIGIICERPMYFDYTFAGAHQTGGSIVMGANTPSVSWFFAEGTTRPGFDPYFTMENPDITPAQVRITFLKGDATQLVENFTVAPGSRSTIRVVNYLGMADDTAHDFSAVVESTNGVDIICERPTYFIYTFGGADWAGGTDVVGVVR